LRRLSKDKDGLQRIGDRGGKYKKRKTSDSTREATQALGATVMLTSASDTLLLTVKSDCIARRLRCAKASGGSGARRNVRAEPNVGVV
jgi:NAD(P)H-hydrate repair Nnr-like enzyme with NAD(P)H-hydrate dehydratase domain